MKATFVSLIVLATASSLPSFAATHATSRATAARPSSTSASGNFGLGVMLGDPSGITAKNWLSSARAFDIGLSYSFNDYFAILGDYLWHFPGTFTGRVGNQFLPYVGLGALVFFDTGNGYFDRKHDRNEEAALGARIPLGVEFLPKSLPLGVFAEVVPGVGLIPSVFGFVQGELGGRYYF
jgi:hypothetical protein